MKLTKILPLAAAAAICALAAPAAQAAVPGVNIAGAPSHSVIQEALDTGAKTVRMFVLWDQFEPDGPGEYPSTANPGLVNLQNAYDQAIQQIDAAGARPVFVVVYAPSWANGSSDPDVPPIDPAPFGDFLRRFAAHNATVGPVDAYEVWNEPDENLFWHPSPDPAKYTAMLKAAYTGIKAADPSATVVAGPTTGNDYTWLDDLYANGAQGYFDAVAVHTDTACLTNGPDFFYRDNGRVAQYSFLGYRTVHEEMAAHGDGGKPILMTEFGWSSTDGGPTSCTTGTWAGQKPDGVSEADQAAYLTKAYSCMANDPYVTEADWFTMRDTTTDAVNANNHYGLLRADGSAKPALAAFRAVVAANGGAPGSCGDFDPPAIRVVSPTADQQFVDKLDLSAAATDAGVGVARITFTFDGGQQIRNFTDGLSNDVPVGLSPWQGSGKLPLGPHTIEVTALDRNGNTSTEVVHVTKVATLASSLMPAFKLKTKKVRCRGHVCSVAGLLSRGAAAAGVTPSIGGKVAVEWQFRNKQGKWRKLVGGLKPANKPFSFKAKLKFKGKWRVRLVYQGQAPWKKASSKYLTFSVR